MFGTEVVSDPTLASFFAAYQIWMCIYKEKNVVAFVQTTKNFFLSEPEKKRDWVCCCFTKAFG
jgi:hypothetical protein